VILDTRSNFFRLLQAIHTVQSRERSAERAELQAKLSKKEFEVGTLTKIEYLDVVSKYKQIVTSLIKEKRDFELLELTFKQGLRLSPSLKLLIDKETLHKLTFRKIDQRLEDLFALAMANRPEVEQRRVDMMRLRKEYEIAEAYYYPRVSLTGHYNLSGDRFFPQENGWGVGIIVTSNLLGNMIRETPRSNVEANGYNQGYSTDTSVGVFEDLSYRRQKIEAGMNLKRGIFERDRLPDLLAIEVKNALVSAQHNYEIFKIAEEAEKVLSERIQIQTAKVRLGQLKRVDLMLAEIEYLGVAQNFIKAKADYLISVGTLEYTIGVKTDFLGLINYNR
jgi:outer membrane protein TolC